MPRLVAVTPKNLGSSRIIHRRDLLCTSNFYKNTMGSQNKRKHQEESGGRPTKKPAITPVKGSVKVKFIDNSDVPGPILGKQPV